MFYSKVFIAVALAVSVNTFNAITAPAAFADSNCGLGWTGDKLLTGNLHEVKSGTLYRSAQLSKKKLKTVIENCHIRLIINLRDYEHGEAVGKFHDELKIAQDYGVKFINISMSATKEVSRKTAVALLNALQIARGETTLVHCKIGADRTGLFTALYEWLVMGLEKRAAEKDALSLRYGHLSITTGAMNDFFERTVGENYEEVVEWVNDFYEPRPGAEDSAIMADADDSATSNG